MPVRSSRRHLILAGGGHSHVAVLRSLSMRPEPGVRLTVISPAARAVYSGMVPGRLVGRYGADETSIDVAALAARAGAAFYEDRVVSLEPPRGVVCTGEHGEIPYDLLSLDVGSRPLGIEGVASNTGIVGVKPVEEAAERISAFVERAARDGRGSVAVIGAGAGGVEVAFALRARLAPPVEGRIALVEAGSELLPGGSPRMRRLVRDLVRRHGIEAHVGRRFASFDGGAVHLDDGRLVPADLVVWATGAEGLPFLRDSGLPVDERGFVWVDEHLRAGAEGVFAVGDCARMRQHPTMPRAGVFAVRQGPILDENLRRTLRSRPLLRYHPQRDFLSLLSTGDGRAAVSYYGFAAHGRAWWRLKDWIDRRFVAGFAPPTPTTLRRGPEIAAKMGMEACGGCAAKVGPDILARTLENLAGGSRAGVPIGLAQRDDAAVLVPPRDEELIFTVDAFPPFLRDPLVVGEVAALNALSDVYAMGGRPTAALALVGVASEDGKGREADLRQMMSGASTALGRLDVPLVGGHSIEMEAPLIGFAVVGSVPPGQAMTKGAARAGDRLLLTKPLGTGVILAATRAGQCPAPWTAATLTVMREANDVAARALVQAGVRCCTDVSGFGLAGHLGEMLDASNIAAELWADAVPALPGALELLAHAWRSSAHDGLENTVGPRLRTGAASLEDPRVALLLDPQTSGGLLASVPEDRWAAVQSNLASAGVSHASIGRLHDGARGEIRIADWSDRGAVR